MRREIRLRRRWYRLVAQGFLPEKACGAEFGTLMRKEYEDYGRVIRDANIKAE
jgi:hypothetical protein